MPVLKVFSADETSRVTITLSRAYEELLRKTEQQSLKAKEMTRRARIMIEDAVKMRKPSPRPLLP